MWYVCDVLYEVLYVRVSCFVVCGCAVSRTYIHVCNGDMFNFVNVYLDHLKLCVVCINDRMYVCCSECNVVSNECNGTTTALCNLSSVLCCKCIQCGVGLGIVMLARGCHTLWLIFIGADHS